MWQATALCKFCCSTHKGNKIYLDQVVYLKKVLEHFGMQNAKATKTPLIKGYNPSENKEVVDPKLRAEYQSIIGSLLYLMLGTHPDICYAVTKLSQFAAVTFRITDPTPSLSLPETFCRCIVDHQHYQSYTPFFRLDNSCLGTSPPAPYHKQNHH